MALKNEKNTVADYEISGYSDFETPPPFFCRELFPLYLIVDERKKK